MGILRDFTLKFLSFNSLSQHADLVFVEVLNSINHHLLLSLFHGLILKEDFFLFEQLVLFKVRC